VAEKLEAFLVAPEREVWSGEAGMVIARGTEGEVGVMKGHAPMLIRLAVGPLRIQRDGRDVARFAVRGGFMHVVSTDEATRVDVLADGAIAAEDIDPEEARRQQEQAKERLAADGDDIDAQALAEWAAAQILVSNLP